ATGTTTAGRCTDGSANFYYTPPRLPSGVSKLTYAGGCGSSGNGGTILVQPGPTSSSQVLPWVDMVENFCSNGAATPAPRNPELRGDGFTPLARSIQSAITNWYNPILAVSKGAGLNP